MCNGNYPFTRLVYYKMEVFLTEAVRIKGNETSWEMIILLLLIISRNTSVYKNVKMLLRANLSIYVRESLRKLQTF